MSRNAGWFLLISAFVLLFPCACTPGDPLNYFDFRLRDFTMQLQWKGVDLRLINVSQVNTVSEPEVQALEILNSARLLTERDGRFEARTLIQLGVSEQDLKWMADVLVQKRVIRRGDEILQVDWTLPAQSFQTLATVHPMLWMELPHFEPLLYFTPVRITDTIDNGEELFPTASGRNEPSMPFRLSEASGLFASMQAPILAPAPQVEGSWLMGKSRKLTIWNGYGPCVTVIWTVRFRTDGCKILDGGNHTYPSPEVSQSLSCLFWDVESKVAESKYPAPQVKCNPTPGSNKRVEECLKSTLTYTPGLRLLGNFVPLQDAANASPQDVCCSEQPNIRRAP